MNKAIIWIKQHKFLSFCVVIALCYAWYAPPFKQTDPRSPLFVESWFRLRNYGDFRTFDIAGLQQDLAVLFPVGTPKEYVDLMLVERGGAIVTDQTNYNFGKYAYSYQPVSLWFTPDAWIISVYYNEQNKVDAVAIGTDYSVGKGYKPKDRATGAKNG